MPPEETNETQRPESGWGALRRFLPYLWPKGERALKVRVVVSFLLVLISIAVTTVVMPLAYGAAIDRMTAGMEAQATIGIALVAAFAGARFAGVLFDNLRNG